MQINYVWLETKKLPIALVSSTYSKIHDPRSVSGGRFSKLFVGIETMQAGETYLSETWDLTYPVNIFL